MVKLLKQFLCYLKICNKALLQELSLWNADGNFDRVSSLGMLMLVREDVLRLLGETKPESNVFDDANYLGNDNFFDKNYHRGKKLILE